MSFCTRVNNYCAKTFDACRTGTYNTYKRAETRFFIAFPGSQNLKAALATIPTILRQLSAAGSARGVFGQKGVAAEGALQGVGVGLGVAAGAAKVAEAIPLVCGCLAGMGQDFAYDVPRPLRPVVGLAPFLAGPSVLASIVYQLYSRTFLSAGKTFLYFQTATVLSGPVRARIHGSNGEETKSLHLQMIAGLAAGVSSAHMGSTPGEVAVITCFVAGTQNLMRGRVAHVGLLSNPEVIGTGMASGAAVVGLVVAGPLGAIGAGAVTGALLKSAEKMYSEQGKYFTPVKNRFNQAKDEIRDEIRRRGQLVLLAQHGLPNLKSISIGSIITEYTG